MDRKRCFLTIVVVVVLLAGWASTGYYGVINMQLVPNSHITVEANASKQSQPREQMSAPTVIKQPALHVAQLIKITNNDKKSQSGEDMPATVINVPPLAQLITKSDNKPCDLEPLQKISKRLQLLDNYRNPCWKEGGRLHCLPFFYQIGILKSGSSDLFFNLVRHQSIVSPRKKEYLWWARDRLFAKGMNNYISHFGVAAGQIEKHQLDGIHHIITGDGTPGTMCKFNYYRKCINNGGSYNVTTAHYIHALQPDAKFVVIMRNPTDRFFSQYLHFAKPKTADAFDEAVRKAVDCFKKCEDRLGTRTCGLDYLYQCKFQDIGLQYGIYYLYWEEWTRVFNRNQMHAVRNEEFAQNKEAVLNGVFDFLGVGPPNDKALQEIMKSERAAVRNLNVTIRKDTQALLDEFYHPYNVKLAEFLGDNNYLWERPSL